MFPSVTLLWRSELWLRITEIPCFILVAGVLFPPPHLCETS